MQVSYVVWSRKTSVKPRSVANGDGVFHMRFGVSLRVVCVGISAEEHRWEMTLSPGTNDRPIAGSF
jgi:hypothetical protein